MDYFKYFSIILALLIWLWMYSILWLYLLWGLLSFVGLYFSSRKIFSQYFHKFFSSWISLLPPIETLFTCMLLFFYDVYRSVEAVVSVSALFSLCVSIWIVSSALFSRLLIFSSTVSYIFSLEIPITWIFHFSYHIFLSVISAWFCLTSFLSSLCSCYPLNLGSIFIIAALRYLSADSVVAVIFVCFCWLFYFFLLSIIHLFLLHLMASFFYSVLPVVDAVLLRVWILLSSFEKCRILFW